MDKSFLDSLYKVGKYQEALDHLDQLPLEERSTDVINQKIAILIELYKLQDAEILITYNLEKTPEYSLQRVETMMHESNRLLLYGQSDASLNLIEEALTILQSISTKQSWWKNVLSLSLSLFSRNTEVSSSDMKISQEEFNRMNTQLLLQKARIINTRRDIDGALKILLDIKTLSQEVEDYRSLIDIDNYLAVIYRDSSNVQAGLDVLQHANDLILSNGTRKQLGYNYFQLAMLSVWNGDFTAGVNYAVQSLEIRKTLPNPLDLSASYNNLAMLLGFVGEFDQAMSYYQQSADLRKELHHKFELGGTYLAMGMLELELGNFANAKDLMTKSIELNPQKMNYQRTLGPYEALFEIAIIESDQQGAKQYMDEILKLVKDEEVRDLYKKFAKASLQMKSKLTRERAEAQDLFREILNKEVKFNFFNNRSTVFYIEMLLEELKNSGDESILLELQGLVEKLHGQAKAQQRLVGLIDALIMRSRILLIQFNFNDARSHLAEAEKIARDLNSQPLMQRVSSAFDKLLDQTDRWKDYVEKNVDLIDLVKQSELEDLVIRMIRKKTKDIADVSEETPILLMIMSDYGMSLYNKTFTHLDSDSQLIAGFISAINAFSSEAFAATGSIERIKHNEYTISLLPDEKMTLCYAYTGPSFATLSKVENVMRELKKDSQLWHVLNNPASGIQDDDFHKIEQIVTNTFI